MDYAKLINGWPAFAPRKVRYGDYWVYNPPASILLELGYKPVQYADPPEVPAGYQLEESWTEDQEKITQIWTLVPDPEPDPEEV